MLDRRAVQPKLFQLASVKLKAEMLGSSTATSAIGNLLDHQRLMVRIDAPKNFDLHQKCQNYCLKNRYFSGLGYAEALRYVCWF
jgi:hypothetical protein